MTNLKGLKGRYSKSALGQKLLMHDPPTTSVQDIICTRTNDTSTDVSYPNDRYISVKNLGDGSASTIFEGLDKKTGCKVIIKKISKKEYWRKELEILKILSHNTSGRLLKYLDFFESQRSSYIITEFCSGFDLFEHIDLNVPYTEKRALILALEMANCIKECHDNNILHLDIKCENYMVKFNKLFNNGKPDIVLIDFGHSEIIPKDQSIHQLRRGYSHGTVYYTSPEGHYEKIHSSKSDIWSLAVCLSLLLTGDYPYRGRRHEYYQNSLIDNVSFTKNFSYQTKKLVFDSLSANPFNRPDIDTFIKRITDIIDTLE